MNPYRLKRKYIPATRVVTLYRYAFYLVFVAFLLELGVTLAALSNSNAGFTTSASPLAVVAFMLAFALIAVLMVAMLVLWIGMLHFLITYDGRSLAQKGFWFILMLFGVSFGAALYFLFVYRQFLMTISTRNAGMAQHESAVASID